MTDEEKAEIAKAEAEAQAEAEQANARNLKDEEELNKQNLEIDYEALAKEERERREAAERLLAEDRYKQSEVKRKAEEEILEEDEDKPITAKDLQTILARERQTLQKDSQKAAALEIARANTATEAEAQAAALLWETRVVPTGNLEADVKFAIGGINQKKIVAKNAELARALRAKDTVLSDPTGDHRDGLPSEAPKLPDNSPLKGYEWKGNGIYAKKLANGKTLYRNAKPSPGQPKTWVE